MKRALAASSGSYYLPNVKRQNDIFEAFERVDRARRLHEDWYEYEGEVHVYCKLMIEEFESWIEFKQYDARMKSATFIVDAVIAYICSDTRRPNITPFRFGKTTEDKLIKHLHKELAMPDINPFLRIGMQLYREFLSDFLGSKQ